MQSNRDEKKKDKTKQRVYLRLTQKIIFSKILTKEPHFSVFSYL